MKLKHLKGGEQFVYETTGAVYLKLADEVQEPLGFHPKVVSTSTGMVMVSDGEIEVIPVGLAGTPIGVPPVDPPSHKAVTNSDHELGTVTRSFLKAIKSLWDAS